MLSIAKEVAPHPLSEYIFKIRAQTTKVLFALNIALTLLMCAGNTHAEMRWSVIDLSEQETDASIWRRAERGQTIHPKEWERFSKSLSADHPHSGLKALADLAAGLGWFRQGLYYRADRAFSRLPSDHPLIEVHLFFWAESAFHRGEYALAADRYQRLEKRAPASLWSHRARFREVDVTQALGDLEGAYQLLNRLIDRYTEYPYMTAAKLQAADLAIKLGRFQESYERLISMEPSSLQDVSSVRGRELLESLINSKLVHETRTASERLKQAQSWRKWKNYEAALSEVRLLLNELKPGDKEWPEAALEEVRILNKMERFEEAIELNDRLKVKLPKGYRRRSNLWWKSEALFRLKRVEEAATTFKKSRTRPNSAGNQARLGMIYFNGAFYEEAERAFQKAIDRGQKGDSDLWMARRLHKWLPYRLGRYEESAKRFKRMCKSGRGSNHYAHYWWARSVQKLGRHHEAIKIYERLIERAPYSFYAYLAEVRLEEVGRSAITPWQRRSSGTSPVIAPLPSPLDEVGRWAKRYGDQLQLWEMIYGLTFIGETSWARVYLRSLTEENRAYFRSSGAKRRRWSFAPRFYLDNRDDSKYGIWGERQSREAPRDPKWAKGISALRPTPLRKQLFSVYRSLGENYYSRRRHYYDGPKLTFPEARGEGPEWQRRYPRSFQSLVESSSSRYSIDPHLIWALMTVESAHNPWAISRVGARGLMQVMPHTGQLSADRMSWPYFGSPLLFEPEVAIEMAAWYFHELIEQFQGQLPLAMAAYNAGPHRVKIWLDFKNQLPLDELIEEIPYAQAREYAKKVTRHLGLYRRIYLGHTGHLFDLRVNPYPKGNINF